jgi:6-phosphogluconolactonase
MNPAFWPCLLLALAPAAATAAPELVYIGTYTGRPDAADDSHGIYAFHFDPATGAMSAPFLAGEARNPTFLAFDPGHQHLYAIGELRQDPPASPARGGISAFQVDPASGRLTFLNQVATGGPATTHVAVDATGRMVIAANFGAGYVAAAPIESDGSVGAPSATISDLGRAPLGPNRDRQSEPHAHSVTISPDNRFAFVCDLGLDRVFSYRIDPATASLTPNDPPAAIVPPGSGPRHSKFSPDGRFLYVSDEMGGTLCVFAYDAARGALALKQTIATLPADFQGVNTVAELRVHPNGRFVYASNRGHDSITVFARDRDQGTLTFVQSIPCGGQHPRNFNLTPDGGWLLCANRDTNNVVAFQVDPATGRLTLTPHSVRISKPVCVLFYN